MNKLKLGLELYGTPKIRIWDNYLSVAYMAWEGCYVKAIKRGMPPK